MLSDVRGEHGMGRGSPRIVIVGAGPTGLGAGYRLRELGHEAFHIHERGPALGGLARSVTDEHGFTWDHGGHVLFSHYEYYDRVFERLMGDEFTLNSRESWVRALGRWVPYPFQNNIRYLGPEAACECLSGLVRARLEQAGRGAGAPCQTARNFGEFIDTQFGAGVARVFMRPYNFKVWAHPPEMLAVKWIGERVAVVDVDRAIRNVVLGQDDFGWGPNNRFRFPLRGGTGGFYARFGPILEGRVSLGSAVCAIDLDRREATLADGRVVAFDALLSTMPLDVLCRDVLRGGGVELARVRRAALRLRHSSGHFVGVGIRRPCPSTRSWMYFADDDCPFYRVTYLSNYSPFMTPDARTHYSLLCEIGESGFKPVDGSRVVEDTVRGLIAAGLIDEAERRDIVSLWHAREEYAYPTPTVDRDEILSEVIPWLEARGVYSRGRFGMWKYEVSNTDHSLMQGVEWVNRVLLGEPEKTIGMVYEVREDGRGEARHERASVAGSGEKRLPEVVVVRGVPAGGRVPEAIIPSPAGSPAVSRPSPSGP